MSELRARLDANEQPAGECNVDEPTDGANTAERIERLEDDLTNLADRVDEIAAATQALRGYAGYVRSVNETVEERTDAALAAIEALEDRLAGPDDALAGGDATSRTRATCDACGRIELRQTSGTDDRLAGADDTVREPSSDSDPGSGESIIRGEQGAEATRSVADGAGMVDRFRDLL